MLFFLPRMNLFEFNFFKCNDLENLDKYVNYADLFVLNQCGMMTYGEKHIREEIIRLRIHSLVFSETQFLHVIGKKNNMMYI